MIPAAWVACAWFAAAGQVTPGSDPESAVRIQLSGRVGLHWAYRGGPVNEAADVLNGVVPPDSASSSFWAGRTSLRTDLEFREKASGVVELETRSFDAGQNAPKDLRDGAGAIFVRQAYAELPEFITPPLRLRLGVQDVAWKNRPQGEPFFLSLGESEGFFEGVGASEAFIRNTSDRDVREAVGAKMSYDLAEFATAQALILGYGEPPGGGSSDDDESVYALALNAGADALAGWVLGVWSDGAGEGQQVGTLGMGIDFYPADSKQWELFGEAYLQGGRLSDAPRRVSKRAWAAEAGARMVFDGGAVEASGVVRTGDDDPVDGTDRAFQSYENVNRFLILESAEFGLDLDTNYRSFRGALEIGPVGDARFRLDVGIFRLQESPRDAAGARLADRDLGVEVDPTVRWAYTESMGFWMRGAALMGAGALDDLSGREGARSAVLGADLAF